MIDPAIVGVISATTALVASIAGPVVTLYVGRSQIRASVLSANRQNWIDGFRDLIAAFRSQVSVAALVRDKIISDGKVRLTAEPEVLHQFEKLVFTLTKIKLMINPEEHDHKKLEDMIEKLLMRLRTAPISVDIRAEAEAEANRITTLSLTILRREWRRVQRVQ